MIRAAAIVALLFATAVHAAATDQQLADCRAIGDEAKRLACYDALSSTPAAAPVESTFGVSSVPRAEVKEPDRIDTHVAGKLKGWRKGTLFTLDNGQVWQSVDDRDSDDTLEAPTVTIKRNFMGHYWMKLSGAWQDVQVIRVK
jgi:hypothetical protein